MIDILPELKEDLVVGECNFILNLAKDNAYFYVGIINKMPIFYMGEQLVNIFNCYIAKLDTTKGFNLLESKYYSFFYRENMPITDSLKPYFIFNGPVVNDFYELIKNNYILNNIL